MKSCNLVILGLGAFNRGLIVIRYLSVSASLFLSFQERLEMIGKQYEADKAKLEKIRLLLVMFQNPALFVILCYFNELFC